MEYTINRTKRNSIILSSSFLILYILTLRLFFFFKTPTKTDTLQMIIQNVIFLIPFGYLMLAFYRYFRYYKLTVLQISILIVFILEVLFRSALFINLFELAWKKTVLLTASTIWVATIIVFIVFLFKIKPKDYPGMLSIRYYVISTLLAYIFATTYTFYSEPANPFQTQQLVELSFAIPYFFTIVFATKLYLKE